MRLSIWTYPWDVQDDGISKFTTEVKERVGLDTVSLAVSYHSGRFLQARSPLQKTYFPQDGTIYFEPDQSLWKDKTIKPLIADNTIEHGDMFKALINGRQRTGLKVSCWVVCLHNSRLGTLHPEHVTRNAFGNPNYYNLCPSSPAAREYVVNLVKDITKYSPDMVELETPSFMGFAHEYHHEKDGIGLNPEDDFLFSLCFCHHCMERAKKSGVRVESARTTVALLITKICNRAIPEVQFPGFLQKGIDVFLKYPELYEFLKWRTEPVTSLIEEIKTAANPSTKVVILVDQKNSWLYGIDIADVGRVCDGEILCCYNVTPENVKEMVGESRKELGHDKFLGVGLSVFYPEVTGPDILTSRVKAAIDAGADGINFYNYGLIPAPRLDWVKEAGDLAKKYKYH